MICKATHLCTHQATSYWRSRGVLYLSLKMKVSVSQSCPTPCDFMDCSLCSWNSLDKNTGVGCHALFQGIFPTQGLNPGLSNCRQILYHLSHQGSPRKSTGVGCHFLLQGIFPTQGLNPGLSHCRQKLYHLSHQGSQSEKELKSLLMKVKVESEKIG